MYNITKEQKEKRLLGMQQKVSDTFTKHNDLSYSLFDLVSRFTEVLPTHVNALAYLSDMITDAVVVSGRSSLSRSMFELPVVSNSLNLDKENSTLTLNYSVDKEYPINLKRSYLQSSNNFITYNKDKTSLSSFEDFLRGSPIRIETPDEFFKYTFSLSLESKVVVSAIDLKLGVETDSYPLISEIYYINDNNKKVYITLLNNSETQLNLDDDRQKDNFYRILLPSIKTNKIYFTLEDRNKNSLILDSLSISKLEFEPEGELILGPLTSTSPILKAALEVKGDTDNANFYISPDLSDWYEIATSTDIPFERNVSKILAFNTVSTNSLKREEDFKTLYLRIVLRRTKSKEGLESKQITRQDVTTTGILNTRDGTDQVVYALSKPFHYGETVYKRAVTGSSATSPQFSYLQTTSDYFVRGFKGTHVIEDGTQYTESSLKTKPVRVGADNIDLTSVDPLTTSVYGYSILTQNEKINTKVQKDIVLKLKDTFSKDYYTIVQNNKEIVVDLSLGYIRDTVDVLFFVEEGEVQILDSTSKVVLTLTAKEFEEDFYISLVEEMFETPTAEGLFLNILYPFQLNSESAFSLKDSTIFAKEHLISFEQLSRVFEEKIDIAVNLSKENGTTAVVTDTLLKNKYTERSEETIEAFSKNTVIKLKNKFIKKGSLKVSSLV